MISYAQAAILGLLQGISELFPISSLGHSVIFPSLVGWHINQNDPLFLTFLVGTHLATALVLFVYFWPEWRRLLAGFFRSLVAREIKANDPDARLIWLLIVGTIPAGILGLLFEEPLKAFFASPRTAALFLFLNGVMLLGAEWLRRRKQRMAQLSWPQAVGVGTAQAIALLPGFSRTGATIAGGLLVGLSHEDAVRFSFLLATPIIGAAAVLKLPELLTAQGHLFIGPTLVGALAAGIAAYFAVKFLTNYFQTNKLTPFAVYCILMGLAASLYLGLR